MRSVVSSELWLDRRRVEQRFLRAGRHATCAGSSIDQSRLEIILRLAVTYRRTIRLQREIARCRINQQRIDVELLLTQEK
jgi:hypothetical protein